MKYQLYNSWALLFHIYIDKIPGFNLFLKIDLLVPRIKDTGSLLDMMIDLKDKRSLTKTY